LALIFVCCASAPEQRGSASDAQFRGFIRWGPEQESFQPCGVAWRHRWWLDREQQERALAERQQRRRALAETWRLAEDVLNAQPSCDFVPCRDQTVYVELDGDLSEPGHYGHMDEYERNLSPTRIRYAARTARGSCSQPWLF
jgi:hypothetical protein